MIKDKVSLNKFITIDDIAESFIFLSSPLSSSATGEILKIDEGQYIN